MKTINCAINLKEESKGCFANTKPRRILEFKENFGIGIRFFILVKIVGNAAKKSKTVTC